MNQIASVTTNDGQVEVTTTADARDPSLQLVLSKPLYLGRLSRRDKLVSFAIGAAVLALLTLLGLACYDYLEPFLSRLVIRSKTVTDALAARYSSTVLPLDSLALWFYLLCLVLFFTASLLKLNGSSISFYSVAYGHGAHVKPWLGAPRALRSDEWGYHTPDVLSQAFRSDRFAVPDSDLGPHSASLIGNVPVRDISTALRPQFWGFFLLPVDYAFAFYWQSKALFLIVGLFTWLLFITRSSCWAIAGALWFFFSPFMQWSYSWPSALPEMIGLACFGTVLLCYLLIGQSEFSLVLASIGFAICAVDFAMCAYVPHMIPIAWLGVAVLASWCISHRALILDRTKLRSRAIAVGVSLLLIAAVGIHIYLQLHQTLIAVSQTVYPGKRVVAGGSFPFWQFLTHFMQWTEAEDRFPAAIGNLSEGSGFLWLAPLAVFCLPRINLDKAGRAMLLGLCLCFLALVLWITLPVPAGVAHLLALDKVPPARAMPALGMANVAAVALCASHLRRTSGQVRKLYRFALVAAIFGLCAVVFVAVNAKLDHFFSAVEVISIAGFTTFLIEAFFSGRQVALMFGLVAANVILLRQR